MSGASLWGGETLADWIGQQLTEKGFAPFGIGVPYAAQRAACAYLRDFEFASEVATCISMDTNAVIEVLVTAAELIEESVA